VKAASVDAQLGNGLPPPIHAAKVHVQTDVDIRHHTRGSLGVFHGHVAWSLEFTVPVLKHLNARFPRPRSLKQSLTSYRYRTLESHQIGLNGSEGGALSG